MLKIIIKQKQYYLDHLFPKENETIPSFRFKNFNGEWKTLLFFDIIQHIKTGLNPRDNFKLNPNEAKIWYVSSKNINSGIFFDEKTDKINESTFNLINKRSDLQDDDILFTSIGTVGRMYFIKNFKKEFNINESVYSIRIKKNIQSIFIYHYLEVKHIKEKIISECKGSTIKGIRQEELKKILIKIPNIIEQQKITQLIEEYNN
ncbi:MAG: restriction endonuclease subunit S [Mycoplasmataceae bacterium]|nr:restriction endonuclease subunit S [Mycoplasmataceae bacterium]